MTGSGSAGTVEGGASEMAHMTRGAARSAAIARALFRRRRLDEQTPALFDNTPLQHDGRKLCVDRETAPPGVPEPPAPIPPTSGGLLSQPGGASLADRTAPAAGRHGGSGLGVAPTTAPSNAVIPAAGAAQVCPCGCGKVLGAFSGERHLVCRSFWFSLPYELRRRVMQNELESDRVAACRLVLKMAISRRRAKELRPAAEGRAQQVVAPRGEPGERVPIPAPHNPPKTPAASGGDLGLELTSSASEDPIPSDAGDEVQADPDAPLPAYRPSEVTQRAAAADVAPYCEGLRGRILEFIQARGERGATNEEISDEMKLRLQTVCGRVNELQGDERRGFSVLVVCGGYRKTKSGSTAKVWVAV